MVGSRTVYLRLCFSVGRTAAFVVDLEGKLCEEGARVMRVHTVRDLGLEKCRDEVQ